MKELTINGERLQGITIYDRPAFFSNFRIKIDDVPTGLYMYDVRHDDSGDLCSIENHVVVNHAGTIIAEYPIMLPDNGVSAECINFDDSWTKDSNDVDDRHVLDLRGNYIFTGEYLVYKKDIVLFQIKAIRDIENPHQMIPKGTVGGFIQQYDNLDTYSKAWVAAGAICYGKSRVYGQAYVDSGTTVSGHAKVHGKSYVGGNMCIVRGHSEIKGDVILKGNVVVSGRSVISDTDGDGILELNGHLRVKSSVIAGNAKICGNGHIGKSRIMGDNLVKIDMGHQGRFDIKNTVVLGDLELIGAGNSNIVIKNCNLHADMKIVHRRIDNSLPSEVLLMHINALGSAVIKPEDSERMVFLLSNATLGDHACITKSEDIYTFQKDLGSWVMATAYRTESGDINVAYCENGWSSTGMSIREFGFNYPDLADTIQYMMDRPDD